MKILDKRIQRITPILFCIFGAPAYAEEDKKINVSGQIDLVSKYISRGLTNNPEDDNLAVQLTLNAGYENFYIGYWGSTLDYSFPEFEGHKRKRKDQFEHDFILGYNKKFGDWNWNVWSATYYYSGGKHTTSNELGLTLNRDLTDKTQLTTSVSTYLYDVAYANQGDTFMTLQLDHQLNDRLQARVKTTASYFQDHGKYEGKELGNTEKNLAFRYASLGLNYEFYKNFKVSGEYILGGYDRYDDKQRNLGIVGLTYQF